MALDIGNLLGAAANLTTATAKGKSLKSFIQTVNDFGIQVTNNFEVNLFGLEDITFFVQEVTFGGMSRKFSELHYKGRSIPIPTYIDYDHSGSLKVLNDANGYIYSAISNFLLDNQVVMLKNGITMTIKCLTGDPNYKGSIITLNNVQFEKVDGLALSYAGGDASTFSLSFQYLDYIFTPGGLGKASGVIGAIDKLIS